MRELTQKELEILIEKLTQYIGNNVKVLRMNFYHFLVEKKEQTEHVFRLHKNRVYYCDINVVRKAEHCAKKQLACLGTCLGKFNQKGIFKLHITALDILGKYAKYKLWLKNDFELVFLYGRHVLRSGLAKITQNTPKHAGIVIFSNKGTPLGFGVTAFSTEEARNLEPTAILAYNQADVGLFIRDEQNL